MSGPRTDAGAGPHAGSSRRGALATDSETGETTSLIQCRFTTSGVWEVRVAEAIGLVGVDSESWPVDPKIAPEHLFYLLQRAHVLPSHVDPNRRDGIRQEPLAPAV